MNDTAYIDGFLDKCASVGFSADQAIRLLKSAAYAEEEEEEEDYVPVQNDNFGDVVLRFGVDKTMFDNLFEKYQPFLTPAHLKDRHQYTIMVDGEPAGFVQMSGKGGHFVQVALAPEFRGFGLAGPSVLALAKKSGYPRVGWTADKKNLASLKLLDKLGGGVVKGSMDPRRRNAEGSLFVDKPMHKMMRANLKKLLGD